LARTDIIIIGKTSWVDSPCEKKLAGDWNEFAAPGQSLAQPETPFTLPPDNNFIARR
jgi:hypothetical protein